MGILSTSSAILLSMAGDFLLFGANAWVRLCITGNVFGVPGSGLFAELTGSGLLLLVSSTLFMVDSKLIVFPCVLPFSTNIMSLSWPSDWKRSSFEL